MLPRTGNMDEIVVRAGMLWPFPRTGKHEIVVQAWMLWPFARTGNMEVIIVRAWMLWPFASTGNMDVIISRAGKRRCAPERVRMFIFLRRKPKFRAWGLELRVKVWGLGVCRATLVS